jgi:NADP-dependent 3-hydroxy acid dehydrogenase YdfG
LVDAGMKIVVFDWDGDRATGLANDLGDAAVGLAGDASDDDDVAAAIDAATSLGTLSLLANVGGGGVPGGRTVSRDGTPHVRTASSRRSR